LKLRIGIIGAGRIGQLAHLENLKAIRDCSVVAIADLRPDLARKVAEAYGIEKVYAHHSELLKDRDVDAVFVITHRHASAAITLDALNAGKHVFCEKPMAYNMRQALELVATAERNKLIYAIGYMKRHDPCLQLAHKIVTGQHKDFVLGELQRLRVYCHGGDVNRRDEYLMTSEARPAAPSLRPIAPEWLPEKWYPSFDRFMNVYSHDIDLLVFLMGRKPDVLHARFMGEARHHIVFSVGDCEAIFESAELPVSTWHEGIEFICNEGIVNLYFPAPLDAHGAGRVEVIHRNRHGAQLVTPSQSEWAFKAQAEDFVAAAANRHEPRCSGTSALTGLETIEAIYRNYITASMQ